MPENNDLRIDIASLLRTKAPGLYKIMPRTCVGWLERLIRQQELNELLIENGDKTGADFCRGVLKSLDIDIETRFAERLPDKKNRRVVFASNHPLGGLDGLALIAEIQGHYGGHVWFVVNDLLMAVKPLESVFLPVSKFGQQSRHAMQDIERAFEGNDPIIIFPAGICSRLIMVDKDGKSEKTVHDLPWHKMFVAKAMQHRRDIVPIHFGGENSKDFYRKANLRKGLRIPFNIEQVLLPREMVNSRHNTFTITIGRKISWSEIPTDCSAGEVADNISKLVYRLGENSEVV